MNRHAGIRLNALYPVWSSMIQRCANPRSKHWMQYGGRGITVCEEWRTSYDEFHYWAETNGYEYGLYLDRIDNNGPYSPENCRFVTPQVSNNNRSVTILLTAFGEQKPLTMWMEDPRCKVINYRTLHTRIADGWDAERALTAPLHTRRNTR